ncbi:MAG: hypothetical protein QXV22_05480, partial [Thermoplasmataceae archaeon]
NLNGNKSLNVSLQPSSSVGGNSSIVKTPSSLKNLPAITEQAIFKSLSSNADAQKSVTYNYKSSNFTFTFESGNKPLANTTVAVFLFVNGNEYLDIVNTGSQGTANVSFALGGTYEVLPEATDFNGSIALLNTTTPASKLTLSMSADRLGEINITLQNNFSIPLPDPHGLSIWNYLLPIPFNSSAILKPNITSAFYMVPFAEYNFSFNESAFVPFSNIPVDLKSSPAEKTVFVDPYLITASYNSSITLNFTTKSASYYNSTTISPGSGSKYFSVTAGSYISEMLYDGILLNSTSYSLSPSAFLKNISFTVSPGKQYNNSTEVKWLIPPDTLYINFSYASGGAKELLSEVVVYCDTKYFGLDGNTYLDINGANVNVMASGSNISLKEYFMLASNSKYNFSIVVNDFGGQLNGNTLLKVKLDYYTWKMVG